MVSRAWPHVYQIKVDLHDDVVSPVLGVASEGGRHSVVAIVVDDLNGAAAGHLEDPLGHVLLRVLALAVALESGSGVGVRVRARA